MNTTRILTALAFTSALSFTSHAELITTDTQIRDYQGNRLSRITRSNLIMD